MNKRKHKLISHSLATLLLTVGISVSFSCVNKTRSNRKIERGASASKNQGVSLHVLGIVQDAGIPHAGCIKDCCKDLFKYEGDKLLVSCLGLVDKGNERKFLFEATPDLPFQMHRLGELGSFRKPVPDGFFLTHAHIGHYAGLMYLGREGMNTNEVPVYVMPKMKTFLENNSPWSQLVGLKNVELKAMENWKSIILTPSVEVIPFQVPHRDEFSETVGFKIIGPNKKAIFIPDIDKWDSWETAIDSLITTVDYAFLDATFYNGEEIVVRDISEIPHPFVIESMQLFNDLPREEKAKIYFIHLNHTNLLIDSLSMQSKTVKQKGFNIARQGMRVSI